MIALERNGISGSRSTISGGPLSRHPRNRTARLDIECVAPSIIQRPWDLTYWQAFVARCIASDDPRLRELPRSS